MERLKLQFLAAFEGLHRQRCHGRGELAEMIELVDKLDDLIGGGNSGQTRPLYPGGDDATAI